MSSTSGKDACHRAQVGHFDVTVTEQITLAGATLVPGVGMGSVTSVGTGTGLSGGPITTTGTISLANTAVVPGSYTSANITVDAQGRLTAASDGSAFGEAPMLSGSNQTFTPGSGYTAVVAALAPTGGDASDGIAYTSGVFTTTKAGLYQFDFTIPMLKSAALSGGSAVVQVGIGINGTPATTASVEVYDSQLSTTDALPVQLTSLILAAAGSAVGIYVNNAYGVSNVIVVGGSYGVFNAHLIKPS